MRQRRAHAAGVEQWGSVRKCLCGLEKEKF